MDGVRIGRAECLNSKPRGVAASKPFHDPRLDEIINIGFGVAPARNDVAFDDPPATGTNREDAGKTQMRHYIAAVIA